MLETTANSIKYYLKEKNGDHFQLENMEEENFLIAIVCDGVSKQPCDWMASEMACNQFVDSFRKNGKLDLSQRVIQSVQEVNRRLLSVEGDCGGLSTTFSILVVNHKTNDGVMCNLGDSRIYECTPNELKQLTRDDSIKGTRVVQSELGRRTLQVSSLTNALGKSHIEIRIEPIRLNEESIYVLATDGFYDARKGSFQRDMMELAGSTEWKKKFSELFTRYEISARDDMTAVGIRI
ncbi:protein phosphatase 2C domain-containing protein [bacterium SCSIO 12741]|nr:protein phosphatase 2C domain-containing protein [bacterium SCSIO 12741]